LLAGTYQDLAGNVGAGDVNATVAVSALSTDSTDSSTTSSSSRLSSGDMAGVIIGCIVGAVFLALMCCLVSQRCLVILHMCNLFVCLWSLVFHQFRYNQSTSVMLLGMTNQGWVFLGSVNVLTDSSYLLFSKL